MFPQIQFYASGSPKGQPRARAFAMKGVGVRMYDPATAEGWKSQVAEAARPFLQNPPLSVPVILHLEFYFPRPKSHFRTGARSKELRESAPGYCAKKPDADNAAKAIMDALTVLRMWNDDDQVVHLIVRKLYDDGRGPGCIISIREA